VVVLICVLPPEMGVLIETGGEMGNMVIGEDHIIKGGLAEGRMKDRAKREAGALVYMRLCQRLGLISEKSGFVILNRKTLRSFPWPFQLFRDGILSSGTQELGAYRFKDAIRILQTKKQFKIKRAAFFVLMDKNTAPDTSMECGFDSTSKGHTMDQHVTADHVYRKRKARGDYR